MPKVKQSQMKCKLTNFSKWLKKKMIEEDMNQTDVADLLHISQPMLSYKINNNRFTLEDFIFLTNYFNGSSDVKDLVIY